MSACTFFGHRDGYGLDRGQLLEIIRERILQGDDIFYVGHQGSFDMMVYGCLRQLREIYPHIRVCIVLAYLPTQKDEEIPDSMYPEIECHPQFAIDRRNRWMVDVSDSCICFINHTWGGAYKFAKLAKKRGLTVINIGKGEISV